MELKKSHDDRARFPRNISSEKSLQSFQIQQYLFTGADKFDKSI